MTETFPLWRYNIKHDVRRVACIVGDSTLSCANFWVSLARTHRDTVDSIILMKRYNMGIHAVVIEHCDEKASIRTIFRELLLIFLAGYESLSYIESSSSLNIVCLSLILISNSDLFIQILLKQGWQLQQVILRGGLRNALRRAPR